MARAKTTKAPKRRAKPQKKVLEDAVDNGALELPEDSDNYSDDAMFVEKNEKQTTKRRARTSLATNEYEDDPGRSNSQDFLTAIKNASSKKRDTSKKATRQLKDLRHMAQNTQQDLLNQIDTAQHELVITQTRALHALRRVYGSTFDIPLNSEESHAIDMQHETLSSNLKKKSTIALENAYKLVGDFQSLEDDLYQRKKMLEAQKSPCDFSEISAMLDAGYHLGQNRVEYLVNNRKESTCLDVADVEAEFYTPLDPHKSTWNKTSRGQLKVMKKMARIIHEEE